MPQEITPGFSPENLQSIDQTLDAGSESAGGVESAAEKIVEQSVPVAPIAAPLPAPVPVKSSPATDSISKEVESVLSENIATIYKNLPADRKKAFKLKGEQITDQIVHMIRSGILQVKKILGIIRDWLEMIPGVNAFFLEQEAKIKTDKIQELFDREHASAV